MGWDKPTITPFKDKKYLVMVVNMPTTQYKDVRVCECGYSTCFPGNWSRHKKSCALVPNEKDARIATLEKQLATNHEHYQKELAAKDEQIRELIQVAINLTDFDP